MAKSRNANTTNTIAALENMHEKLENILKEFDNAIFIDNRENDALSSFAENKIVKTCKELPMALYLIENAIDRLSDVRSNIAMDKEQD